MTIRILGIVNITPDSFSDGARFLAPEAAIAQARKLIADGADVVDLGPASSNPDAVPVSAEEEIRRLSPVLSALKADGAISSVDSFRSETQRFALDQGVHYLNDIQGFADAPFYPRLAQSSAKLIVMHSVQGRGNATREDVPVSGIFDRIVRFFDARITSLTAAGIVRDRLILDPGMGFFLSTDPLVSVEVLRRIPDLKRAFGLPVLISVSRKSFLRKLTGRDVAEIGPATLAAELFAAEKGADFIRTHDAGALSQGLIVRKSLGD